LEAAQTLNTKEYKQQKRHYKGYIEQLYYSLSRAHCISTKKAGGSVPLKILTKEGA